MRAARGSASAPRASRPTTARATWHRSPCLGQCERAPAALVSDAGDEPHERGARAGDAPTAVARRARPAGDRRRRRAGARRCRRPATRRCALLRARRRRRPDEPRRLPRARRLRALRARARARPRGRHRARSSDVEAHRPRRRRLPDRRASGRPSRAQPARPHYLVCNADESEPGTFKDRVLHGAATRSR